MKLEDNRIFKILIESMINSIGHVVLIVFKVNYVLYIVFLYNLFTLYLFIYLFIYF